VSDPYEELDQILDEESWEWLDRTAPEIAIIVQRLVKRGLPPEEIGKRVTRRAGEHRAAFAKRCELAARHLERNK
jgi:hypothetical protein